MRFEEVVEELHVELIVLHDQDGLWHSLPALSPSCPCCPECAFVPNARLSRVRMRPRSGMIGTVVPICYGKANLADEARPCIDAGTGRRACNSGPYVHRRRRRKAWALPCRNGHRTSRDSLRSP